MYVFSKDLKPKSVGVGSVSLTFCIDIRVELVELLVFGSEIYKFFTTKISPNLVAKGV